MMQSRVEAMIREVYSSDKYTEDNIKSIIADIKNREFIDPPKAPMSFTYDEFLNKGALYHKAKIFDIIIKHIVIDAKEIDYFNADAKQEIIEYLREQEVIITNIDHCLTNEYMIGCLLNKETFLSPQQSLKVFLLFSLPEYWPDARLFNFAYEQYKKLDYNAQLHTLMIGYAYILIEQNRFIYKNYEGNRKEEILPRVQETMKSIADIMEEIGLDVDDSKTDMIQYLYDY